MAPLLLPGTGLPGGGLPGVTEVESLATHPPLAAPTWNISGCPVKPPPVPAVMLSTQRPDWADAVTLDVPSDASGAS